MEHRAVSQETLSYSERELSDYCFRQWLVSVWGRGKKRERVRATEREGGRENSSEWESEREAAAVWKSRKVAWCSHRKTLGLEEARGSCASHKLSICHSLTALSKGVLSRLYQWRLRQWNGRSLHWNSRLCSHTPRAQTFHLPLFLSCFCYAPFFFPPQTTFSCFLFWALGQRWIFCHRRTSEGKQGARSLA